MKTRTGRLYYRTMYKRTNTIKENFYIFFFAISSWPRLLLEVWIRSYMGQRYFSFSSAVILATMLAVAPLLALSFLNHISRKYSGLMFFGMFTTWYLYLAGFLYMCLKRRREIKQLQEDGVKYFSLSSGKIEPRFFGIEWLGKRGDVRTIETVLEPGFFFVIGIGFWMFGQPIGHLLIICSILYSLSYLAAYYQGDSFILDKTDEMIVSESLVKSFLDDEDSDDPNGFRFIGRRPANPEIRRKMADEIFADDDLVEAQ